MVIGPLTIYRLFLLGCLLVMVIGAAIWAFRDAVIDLRFRWRLRNMARPKGRGKCPRCGYDTRANLSVCSECGEPVQVMRPPPKQLLKK